MPYLGLNMCIRGYLELRLKSGLLAQLVGGNPIERPMPLDGYGLEAVGVYGMPAAIPQEIESVRF